MYRWKLVAATLALAGSLRAYDAQAEDTNRESTPITIQWERLLEQRLLAFGHRNWIVIADSAYPSQSRPGIETVVTNSNQLQVVQLVLDRLRLQTHVRPNVYLDAELPYVDEKSAPGIGDYRQRLKQLLATRKTQSLLHEQIIDKLDSAGEKYNVLVLKTNLTLPYTTVFMELDCGYWSGDEEQRLRAAMPKAEQ